MCIIEEENSVKMQYREDCEEDLVRAKKLKNCAKK
jgi:hypothetical protein